MAASTSADDSDTATGGELDADDSEALQTSACDCVLCLLLSKGFSNLPFAEKIDIIKKGRPQPSMKNLTTKIKTCTRHFTAQKTYEQYEWITGCETRNKLFCWPCTLFAIEKGVWNKSGITDLNNLHKVGKRHVLSRAHLQAVIKGGVFGKTRIKRATDKQIESYHRKHNELVDKNRNIIKRLVDVVCFLGQLDETATSANKGNFQDLVSLVARYDISLKNHLEQSSVFLGTLSHIEKDLIAATSSIILNIIKSEIKQARFIAIILGEATDDVDNLSQLSVVIRYVKLDGRVQERFVGFRNVAEDRTVDAVYKNVLNIIKDIDGDNKLIAQSYDGAAVMAAHLGALQVKVLQTFANAPFVHCSAHKLNLILSQSMNHIKECKIFFVTLSGMAAFFSKSARRTQALDTIIVKKGLPKVATTQWNFNGRLMLTIFEHRECLIEFFENIMENNENWDAETINSSRGLLDALKRDFNFNFLINMFSDIFPFADEICNIFKTNDIGFCLKKIGKFKAILKQKRNEFNKYWKKTSELIGEGEPERKRFRSDNVENLQISYRRLFHQIVDHIQQQINLRFDNLNDFKFIELCQFGAFKGKPFPEDAFKSLFHHYEDYFHRPSLRSELRVIYDTDDIDTKNNANEVLIFLQQTKLEQVYSEVFKLCQLVLTIPVTGASMDRNFSAVKRINWFVRKSTGQERLFQSSILSIENGLVQEMSQHPRFYDDVIDEFAKKNRRIELHFKGHETYRSNQGQCASTSREDDTAILSNDESASFSPDEDGPSLIYQAEEMEPSWLKKKTMSNTEGQLANLELKRRQRKPAMTPAERQRKYMERKKARLAGLLKKDAQAGTQRVCSCVKQESLPYGDYPKHVRARAQFEDKFLGNPFGAVCCICDLLCFERDLKPLPAAAKAAFHKKINFEANHVCLTCRTAFGQYRIPLLSKINGFEYPQKPDHLPELDLVTERLISPLLPFTQIRRLGHGHDQNKLLGQAINLPISVETMVHNLPRELDDDYCVNVNIERNEIFNSSDLRGLIRTRDVETWLRYLVDTPLFKSYSIKINESFFSDDQPQLAEGHTEAIDFEDSLCAQQQTLLWNEGRFLSNVPQKPKLCNPFEEEELAFPTIYLGQIRSFGDNVTPYMLVASELRRADRRYATPSHLLYMAMRIMRLKIEESLKEIFNFISKLTRSQIEPKDLLESNLEFLCTIPNSTYYWTQCKRDLCAMIRQLGKPTFLLTISSNETGWRNLTRLLYKLKNNGVEISTDDLDHITKAKLVNEDPVACAVYFNKLVDTVISILKVSRISPFGETNCVIDFYKKIEFDHRGGTHAHVVLWLGDAFYDVKGQNTNKAATLIDRIVSASKANASGHFELQQHKHLRSCYTKNKCRFETPFMPCRQTIILRPMPEIDIRRPVFKKLYDSLRNSLEENEYTDINHFFRENNIVSEEWYHDVLRAGISTPQVFLKREPSEKWTIPFNPFILNTVESRTELKFITDENACAEMLVDYFRKTKQRISDLLTTLHEHPEFDTVEIARKLSVDMLSAVEISTQEAAWYLLRQPITTSSVPILYLPTVRPTKRQQVINTNKRLLSDDVPKESSDMCHANWFSLYERRPSHLENLTLAEVAIHYNVIRAEWKKRTRPRVIRYRNYDVSEANGSEYKREMVTLFLAFRNEELEILNGMRFLHLYDTYKSVIEKRRKECESIFDIAKTLNICREQCAIDEDPDAATVDDLSSLLAGTADADKDVKINIEQHAAEAFEGEASASSPEQEREEQGSSQTNYHDVGVQTDIVQFEYKEQSSSQVSTEPPPLLSQPTPSQPQQCLANSSIHSPISQSLEDIAQRLFDDPFMDNLPIKKEKLIKILSQLDIVYNSHMSEHPSSDLSGCALQQFQDFGCSSNIDLFFNYILQIANTLSPLDQALLQKDIANMAFDLKILELHKQLG